ncbi:MAG: hypothetical protein IPH27_08980 [Actinomycetales bacterium]|nr:hypothetical protein [Candidatus Phosphoribacter baldrii]MBK6955570.1 hypothetical protein [Candidatus Phosphoribacter baldrii]
MEQPWRQQSSSPEAAAELALRDGADDGAAAVVSTAALAPSREPSCGAALGQQSSSPEAAAELALRDGADDGAAAVVATAALAPSREPSCGAGIIA